jgi:hypothetical protein
VSKKWSSKYGWFMFAVQAFWTIALVVLFTVNGRVVVAALVAAVTGLAVLVFAFRTAVALEIRGEELAWRAPFRSDAVPLGAITRVRRAFASWDRWVIEVEGRRSIVVLGRSDLRRWLEGWGLVSSESWT